MTILGVRFSCLCEIALAAKVNSWQASVGLAIISGLCETATMTAPKQMRLGAFMRPVGIHTAWWRYPGAYPDANFNLRHLVRFIQKLEHGKFDAWFMADHLAVLNMPMAALKRSATVTSFDPLTLLPALAMATKHIGLIATASTTWGPEPIYSPRVDLVAKYPTHPDAKHFRLPNIGFSVQKAAVDKGIAKQFPLILSSGRLVEYEGGGEETRSTGGSPSCSRTCSSKSVPPMPPSAA